MTTEGPDPKTFTSWEDAFQYPMPTTRAIEKQLRRDVESNRERLRSLVGGSYRSLLSTAETIVDMDTQMQEVEDLLSSIGQKCNSRLIERKLANYQAWEKAVSARDHARLEFASQLAVLRNCPNVISSILRKGESILLAAKVLVMSRLLHTQLSKQKNPPPFLETLRSKLSVLRRRLLERIERKFKSVAVEKAGLLEAMCAFSLATSSGLADVVKHFHHLRHDMIVGYIRSSSASSGDILSALKLYIKTLRDTLGLIPEQLSSSLAALKAVPIWRNEGLYDRIELNLDIHKKWFSNDVKNFTPFLRHDDLDKAEANRMLKSWARTTIKSYRQGLQTRIEEVKDVAGLLRMRRQILELWLNEKKYAISVDSVEILDGLRDVFVDQCRILISTHSQSLRATVDAVGLTLQQWNVGHNDKVLSLWSSSMTSMKIDEGGKAFRARLSDLMTGRNAQLSKIFDLYAGWLDQSQLIAAKIKELKSDEWPDQLEDADEDDESLEDVKTLLCVDDPDTLQDALQTDLRNAYLSMAASLASLATTVLEKHNGGQAAFLLRLWRLVLADLPPGLSKERFGEESIGKLMLVIAQSAMQRPFNRTKRRLSKYMASATFAAKDLWEGDPALPVLISPWTYRMLQDMSVSMSSFGPDLWSPVATKTLKMEALTQVNEILKPSMATSQLSNGHVNESDQDGVDDGSPSEQDKPAELTNGNSTSSDLIKDKKIQLFFDISYILCAFNIKDSANPHDNVFARSAQEFVKTLDLDDKDVQRIRKSAAAYWTRTNLLFGLFI